MLETATRCHILAVCAAAALAGGALLAGSAAFAQAPAGPGPGAQGLAAAKREPAAKPEALPQESQGAASAGEPAPADSTLNGVIYQPARASAAKRVLASDDGEDSEDSEERARLDEEGRSLMADPAVQELMQMRLQGAVITPDTPGLSEAQRTALNTLMDYSSRASRFVRPPPPPPPPPPSFLGE